MKTTTKLIFDNYDGWVLLMSGQEGTTHYIIEDGDIVTIKGMLLMYDEENNIFQGVAEVSDIEMALTGLLFTGLELAQLLDSNSI